MRQDAGDIYIRRTDAVRTPATAAYRVTFSPEGNRDVYTFTVRTASVAFSRTLTSLRVTLNRPSAHSAKTRSASSRTFVSPRIKSRNSASGVM